MDDLIKINDDSGDHKYFSMTPHCVLDDSSANDQSLYMQMKRYAGEKGTCWASRRSLMKKTKLGLKAVNGAIKYLLGKKWIILIGKKKVRTNGGIQEVDEYSISNI